MKRQRHSARRVVKVCATVARNAIWRFAEALESRTLLTAYTVNSLLDVVVDDGALTLREAIMAANTNAAVNEAPPGSPTEADIIRFDPALFAGGPATIVTTAALPQISGLMSIQGPGADVLSIEGFVNIGAGATISIDGLTVTGTGVQNKGNLNFTNSVMKGCYNFENVTNATVTMSHVKLIQNYGHGLWNDGTAILTDVEISDNRAISTSGAGIYNTGALMLLRAIIAGNSFSPNGYGAGINNVSGKIDMTNVAIIGNSTGQVATGNGGGICSSGAVGYIKMANVTIAGNFALRGGGIYNFATPITATNVTIARNVASIVGGGVYQGGGTLRASNTIIVGNPSGLGSGSPDAEGAFASGSDYNVIGILRPEQVPGAGEHSRSGSSAAPLDVLLGDITTVGGMPVLPLLASSPAINAGSNTVAVDADGNPLTTDEVGRPRIAGGTVDIGAYEYQPQAILVNGTSGDDAILISGDASTLSWKIGSGAQMSIPRSLVSGIGIDAGQGTDTLTFDFDLLDDDLIIQANPATRQQLFQAASDAVKAARNTTPLWAGHGITSSTAAGDALRGLAAILNEKLDAQGNPTTILGTLDGQSLDTNSIIVKYGLNGDANLDGIVNFDDYFLINTGFLSGGALGGYRNGDFNYDTVINFDDYFLINTAFLGQTSAKPSAPAAGVARPVLDVAQAGRGLHLLKRVRGGARRR